MTFEIEGGSSCAIVGPSGSGKTTLLNIVGLLDRVTAGRLYFGDLEVGALDETQAAVVRNEWLGFVFQSANLLPRYSLSENVALPLLYRGVARDARELSATSALAQVGLGGYEDRLPSQLSAGQRQRVAVARALVGAPRIILADEPTGNLDRSTASSIVDLFLTLSRESHVTVLMVTHDEGLASLCDQRIEMVDGCLSRQGCGSAGRSGR